MSLRNISAWSIRNPVVPLVIFAGLMLMGLVSFARMEVQQQPDIEFPMVIVTITQPGAAPTEIEKQVTQRIESAVRSVSGVQSISSTASEGQSLTMIEFQIGDDIIEAVNEVKNAVDQARGDLPDGILEPSVIKAQTSSEPIAYFAVSADDMTLEQLSWFIDDTVAKRLLSIDGMATVGRGGGVNREILVTLDPARMQSAGVTAAQVNTQLRLLNTNAAGGRAEIAGSRQSVRVLGNAADAYELSQTQIPLGGGRTIKLADVATVRDSQAEVTSIAKMNGKQVVTFGITRARGASDVSVYDATEAALRDIEKANPGIRFTKLVNTVDYTKRQYESSMSAMVEGAVLAVVVVFFFLRDWRATAVSALAIPLSAIPTFWFMSLLGFTLNQMSLLALGLVAGVLVDDAIVEIENIVRHMRMGKTAYQASIDAADEIGLAVVATTFSIVAVFLPVGLMPGVSGQFFKNFGLTVVVSVLMSLAVARMITPMVAAYFIKAHGEAEHAGGAWMDRYLKVLHWSLDASKAEAYRARHRGAAGHLTIGQRLAARLRDHRVAMIGMALGALLLTASMFFIVPSQFFPDENGNIAQVRVEMVPGTTLRQTEQVSGEVAGLLRARPEVESVLERISEGSARVFLVMRKDRDKKLVEFQREMTPSLQQIPDARVTFQSMGMGGGGGSGRPISVMLAGTDSRLLEQTAATLVEQMKGIPGVVAPRVSADMRRPEVVITPRMDLAASLGVTTQAMSQAIRIATIGEIDQNAAKFSLSDRQVPIRVRMPESARRDLSNIANLPVPTASGGTVPLSRVADIAFGSGPTSIQRYNQQRRVFIGADLARGVIKSDAMTAINALPVMKNLPAGVTNTLFGEDRWQNEMIVNAAFAVVAGILLVFSVLVLLYHRFVSPLVNMGSLFLAPLGGLIALLITGQPISMPVIIGILMLFGIVAKNSILLIDFAIEEMAAGKSKFEAVVEAGHKRAVPIVMTTVAMTAGMVPTAVSLSGDAAWRAPMGIVVIGGLILSTALTLLIVPAAFSLADGFEKRVGPLLRRRFLTFEPHHALPAQADRPDAQLPAE
ncbi:efflux RND transporter permease subunit [Novosphingobium flavum]|uniref:Efflux RND transporter permease subunit n=1 Tax=Novosphingobium flavum TaxID=1778672 RepID=A0A7X1FQ54_9SPHN|nr:efflux RND transporter permease subunit [Novosphingobium flavum]MBC2664487.1 efflux RND transporter permease subunit [Novosphingobium flavum]